MKLIQTIINDMVGEATKAAPKDPVARRQYELELVQGLQLLAQTIQTVSGSPIEDVMRTLYKEWLNEK